MQMAEKQTNNPVSEDRRWHLMTITCFSEGSLLNPKPLKMKIESANSLPLKLHKMLDIANWNPNGISFHTKKPEELIWKIMPYYFNQMKYASHFNAN
jgi:hypothetical protein